MAVEALVIGYGAIAGYVGERLAGDDRVTVRWVVVRPGAEDRAREVFGPDVQTVTSVDALNEAPDIALECAGHEALSTHGAAILRRGVDLGVVSIGALTDPDLSDLLAKSAEDGGGRLHLLSGAVGALDALASAREGGLDKVVYSGIKPPDAWRGSPAEEACDLDDLSEPTAFFEGNAREAARRYPKNANVAATVALAGVGLDDTSVRLVADPQAAGNLHHVEAEGAFGRLDFTISGRPLPGNPRSSSLTAMSAVRFLRDAARSVLV